MVKILGIIISWFMPKSKIMTMASFNWKNPEFRQMSKMTVISLFEKYLGQKQYKISGISLNEINELGQDFKMTVISLK